jgi:hypothetical protein
MYDQLTAMLANILSVPTELLLMIIESVVTMKEFSIDERTISFVHEEILSLSQVNQQLRHLCLPQLYKHINIVVTKDVSQLRAGQFESFRRIMEQTPHLAKLVRYMARVLTKFAKTDLRICL